MKILLSTLAAEFEKAQKILLKESSDTNIIDLIHIIMSGYYGLNRICIKDMTEDPNRYDTTDSHIWVDRDFDQVKYIQIIPDTENINFNFYTEFIKYCLNTNLEVTVEENKLEIMLNSDDVALRVKAAAAGYGLDRLIDDPCVDVRAEVANQGYDLGKLINDKHWLVRVTVAEKGYGLDRLINDPHWHVRKIVAEQGYGLDKLIHDENPAVRAEVAKQKFGLDILINDENEMVRAEVARQGYGLDKLINDKDWAVRVEVARQGYGLDILLHDKNTYVRNNAIMMTKNILGG